MKSQEEVIIPIKSKLCVVSKMKSQEEVAIFENMKRNSTVKKNKEENVVSEAIIKKNTSGKKVKNFEDQLIITDMAQQMSKDREDSFEETRKFNDERKKQWERALTGKLNN